MKNKCTSCKRLVGVKRGKLSKHRTGRSTPKKVKPLCAFSGRILNKDVRKAAQRAVHAQVKAPEATPVQAAFADVAQ